MGRTGAVTEKDEEALERAVAFARRLAIYERDAVYWFDMAHFARARSEQQEGEPARDAQADERLFKEARRHLRVLGWEIRWIGRRK